MYDYSLDWDGDLADYIWTEGNYSCDCNRDIFFRDAGGEEEGDSECGDGKYTCLYAELPDGQRIKLDEIEVEGG